MSSEPAVKYMTVEEYLEFEETSTEKHEFIGGVIYAMAGAGVSHNRVVRNSVIEIGQFLKGKPCEIFQGDLKIHVKTESGIAYPDISIVCDGLQFLEGRKDVVTNPAIIIEVLSPSTQNYDHGEKFMFYRQIPVLQEYILISSIEAFVEKFKKADSGSWILTEYKNLTDTLPIDTIRYNLPLSEIYRDVVFEERDYTKGIVRKREI